MRVAVIGGGAMGAATSWRLSKRGVDVVCYDRYSPPHPLGSSHGESRIIRTAYFEGDWYVPLLQEAFTLWRELEATSGKRLLSMTGALMIGDASSHVVHDGDVAVLDRQAGVLNPEAGVAAMLAQAPQVVRDTEVKSVAELRSRFDAVVVAAGPWTPELIDWIPLAIERQVHGWFSIARDADWFGPDRFPAFVRQSRDAGFMYGVPSLDGRTIKIGRHHDGETTTPHTIRRRIDDFDIDPLRLLASTYLRGVSGHVTRTLTCMYTNTPDGHFVVDFAPDDRRVVVISACSGHGFKFAPVIGDIAADLVIDGETRRDISRFSGARFAAPYVPDDNDSHNE